MNTTSNIERINIIGKKSENNYKELTYECDEFDNIKNYFESEIQLYIVAQ